MKRLLSILLFTSALFAVTACTTDPATGEEVGKETLDTKHNRGGFLAAAPDIEIQCARAEFCRTNSRIAQVEVNLRLCAPMWAQADEMYVWAVQNQQVDYLGPASRYLGSDHRIRLSTSSGSVFQGDVILYAAYSPTFGPTDCSAPLGCFDPQDDCDAVFSTTFNANCNIGTFPVPQLNCPTDG